VRVSLRGIKSLAGRDEYVRRPRVAPTALGESLQFKERLDRLTNLKPKFCAFDSYSVL